MRGIKCREAQAAGKGRRFARQVSPWSRWGGCGRVGLMDEEKLRDDSWTGDAVLGLCAREWIMAHERELGRARHELFRDLTSNAFLASVGKPTEVEARLGRIYREEGLVAARGWFEATLVPLFLRQERKRRGVRR